MGCHDASCGAGGYAGKPDSRPASLTSQSSRLHSRPAARTGGPALGRKRALVDQFQLRGDSFFRSLVRRRLNCRIIRRASFGRVAAGGFYVADLLPRDSVFRIRGQHRAKLFDRRIRLQQLRQSQTSGNIGRPLGYHLLVLLDRAGAVSGGGQRFGETQLRRQIRQIRGAKVGKLRTGDSYPPPAGSPDCGEPVSNPAGG